MSRRLRSPRLLSIALLAVTLVLAPAAASTAKAPPRGSYTCTTFNPSFGTQFAGTVKILRKGRYRVNGGKKGRFTTNGKRIRYRTGAYRGTWKGRWKRANGQVIIDHFFTDDREMDSAAQVCTRSR